MWNRTAKVPFTVEQPNGDFNVRVSPPYAAKLTRESRTRSMMWLWTGEVSAGGQGYRVLATGPKESSGRSAASPRISPPPCTSACTE